MKDNKNKKFNYPFKHGGALTAADMNIIGDMMRALGWIDEQGYVVGELTAVRGPMGPQGATGPAGIQGATGPQGNQGATGPQGDCI